MTTTEMTISDPPDMGYPLAALYASLAKAQAEFQPIEKNQKKKIQMKRGGAYDITWADLGAIRSQINPILGKYGLSVTQSVSVSDKGVTVKTTLNHESGLSICSDGITLPAPLNDPKEIAGYITYACRYDLIAFLNLPIIEDDDIDGCDTSDTFHDPKKIIAMQNEPQKPNPLNVKKIEIKEMTDTNDDWDILDVKAFCQYTFGKPSPETLGECEKIIAAINSGLPPKKLIQN